MRGLRSPRCGLARSAIPTRFTATIAGSPVDLHVFEDALLVIADGSARRIAFSFVTDVHARDYTVTIDAASQDTLAVTASAGAPTSSRRCSPSGCGKPGPGRLPSSARCCPASTRWRCAPPPRCCATGWRCRARALDAIHPDLSATLLRVATLPDRLAAVRPR